MTDEGTQGQGAEEPPTPPPAPDEIPPPGPDRVIERGLPSRDSDERREGQ